jgi:hypothetical protein
MLEQHALIALTETRALAVDNLDETGIISTLMFHYNRYRGLKAFLLDINHAELAYKGVSSFLVASSPEAQGASADPIEDLKAWILSTLKSLQNTNLTLVISCPASSLYRFADVIDRADPPLANIDFAPLHQFDEIVNDAKLRYDILLIEQRPAPLEIEGPDEAEESPSV